MSRNAPIGWGEPAPWFTAPTPINPTFHFSSMGGRFVALAFIGHIDEPSSRAFVQAVADARLPRDDSNVVSFAVSIRGQDLKDPLLDRAFPPQRIFHDPEWAIAKTYGLIRKAPDSDQKRFYPTWVILDPQLRVWASGSVGNPNAYIAAMRALPAAADHAGVKAAPWAPVLLVPRVLDLAFCKELIELYKAGQPKSSGFMENRDGKTVGKLDPSFKRRYDVDIAAEPLREKLRFGLRQRLIPQIEKAFQFTATRIERYIVACYDGQEGGFFRAHRDNTTAGTAHRRFAVTINLNAEDYDGGELWFPEYGTTRYKAPTGGAIVFSCSLLHEATPVTRGLRYATLPFLYDDAAAEIRTANRQFIVGPPPLV
ncbi:MAG: 2OG-Fe(II) oxygenase [Alphaproteobacteria bacterium]|nr:MAG: 2OG-Fe(II) oxygenase [Alphaproteobacteria bacterium]